MAILILWTMKYPSCILNGEAAKAMTISIAVAGKKSNSRYRGKMFHKAPNTQSTVISKSVSEMVEK